MHSEENRTSQFGSEIASKQCPSKKEKGRQSASTKTHVRHWEKRIFKASFTRNGQRHETADYCVKIGHLGRRETFNLKTANKEAAASRALNIYRKIIGAGWEAALNEFKPKAAAKPPVQATIGEWLKAVQTRPCFKIVSVAHLSEERGDEIASCL